MNRLQIGAKRRGVALVAAIGLLAVLMVVVIGVSTGSMIGRSLIGQSELRAHVRCEESSTALLALREWRVNDSPTSFSTELALTERPNGGPFVQAGRKLNGDATITIETSNAADARYANLGASFVQGDVWLTITTEFRSADATRLRRTATYLCRDADWNRRVQLNVTYGV